MTPHDDFPSTAITITTGNLVVDPRSVAATHHPDTRYLNRAERRAAGYVRRSIPVGGVIVRKEVD